MLYKEQNIFAFRGQIFDFFVSLSFWDEIKYSSVSAFQDYFSSNKFWRTFIQDKNAWIQLKSQNVWKELHS